MKKLCIKLAYKNTFEVFLRLLEDAVLSEKSISKSSPMYDGFIIKALLTHQKVIEEIFVKQGSTSKLETDTLSNLDLIEDWLTFNESVLLGLLFKTLEECPT